MHSNVISNWNGFPNGLGLSSTATFNTCTLAITDSEAPDQLCFPSQGTEIREVARYVSVVALKMTYKLWSSEAEIVDAEVGPFYSQRRQHVTYRRFWRQEARHRLFLLLLSTTRWYLQSCCHLLFIYKTTANIPFNLCEMSVCESLFYQTKILEKIIKYNIFIFVRFCPYLRLNITSKYIYILGK